MLGGSVVASFCQGVLLGAFIQGIHIENDAYAGGWWDWLSPFSVLCGMALVVGYALLGSCWLVWRTEGELQQRSRRQARILMLATLGFIFAVSVWTPLLRDDYAHRWFAWPSILLVSPVPILLALCAGAFWWTLSGGYEVVPLVAVLACFLLCYAGFGISIYPNIIPPSLGIAKAASARSSEIFALVGSAVLIPAILAYSTYSFWIFHGKVKPKVSLEQQHGEPKTESPVADNQALLRMARETNRGIKKGTERRAPQLAGQPGRIQHRLEQLEREWDVQQALAASAAVLSVTGLLLGLRRHRAYFALPALAAVFVAQQARQGWCPLYPILRVFRFRPAEEIERERAAIGDLRNELPASQTGKAGNDTLERMKRELAEASR
jgi:hypothetical protein